MNQNIKAVIFDVDDTLTTQNSWAQIAFGMGASHEEDLDIYYKHKSGEYPDEIAFAKLSDMWKRQGLATKENFQKIFDSIPLQEDAIDLVSYLKQKNIHVCLITGSMDMFAEAIAKKVGADSYYFNADLFWESNGNFKNFTYHVQQGELKVKQFVQFCQKHEFQPEECVVIGDSENDRQLFALTKKGIAVRTKAEDKELEKLAWKVVNNLSEIKRII